MQGQCRRDVAWKRVTHIAPQAALQLTKRVDNKDLITANGDIITVIIISFLYTPRDLDQLEHQILCLCSVSLLPH